MLNDSFFSLWYRDAQVELGPTPQDSLKLLGPILGIARDVDDEDNTQGVAKSLTRFPPFALPWPQPGDVLISDISVLSPCHTSLWPVLQARKASSDPQVVPSLYICVWAVSFSLG